VAAPNYKPREIAARGEAFYREHIEPQAESLTKGSFVVIDVETGEYEIDDWDIAATRRLLERRPNAVTYGVRVGHRAAYSQLGPFGIPIKGVD
jgi:hypothetical protein